MPQQKHYPLAARTVVGTDEFVSATTPLASRSLNRIKSFSAIAVSWLLLGVAFLALCVVGDDININTDEGLINTLLLWIVFFGIYAMAAVAVLGTIISVVLWFYPATSRTSSYVTTAIQGVLFVFQCVPLGLVILR